MSTVIVTGGRDYPDRDAVFAKLDAVHAEMDITLLMHGACTDKKTKELTGADRWAEEWARERGVPYIGVPAKWNLYGNSAGPRRNREMPQMAKRLGVPARAVVAFPGGRGTRDMRDVATHLGITILDGSPALDRIRRAGE